jgi:hypothetical protein
MIKHTEIAGTPTTETPIVDTTAPPADPGNLPDWEGFANASDSDVELGEDAPAVAPDVDPNADPSVDPPVDPNAVVDDNTAPPKQEFDPRTGDLIDPAKPVVDEEAEVYTGIATILKGQGFFKDVEDLSTIKDPSLLASALDNEVKSRLTDRQKEIMEYMNQGVPIQQVSKLQTALSEAEGITAEMLATDTVLGKNLIISDLVHKGIDETQAEKFYGMMVSSGEDKEEAIRALATRKSNLTGMIDKEVTTAKATTDAKVAKAKASAVELETKLGSTEIFGRKIASTTADRIKVLAGTPVAYTESGEPLNAVMKYRMDNPIDFEHKLLYLFSATNGFTNLNSFDRSAESRLSNTMKNAVKTMSSSEDVSSNRVVAKKGTVINVDDIDDII